MRNMIFGILCVAGFFMLTNGNAAQAETEAAIASSSLGEQASAAVHMVSRIAGVSVQ